jgi:hypothetical protein
MNAGKGKYFNFRILGFYFGLASHFLTGAVTDCKNRVFFFDIRPKKGQRKRCFHDSLTLKMGAVGSLETPLLIFQTTQHNNSECRNFNAHLRKNLKSHKRGSPPFPHTRISDL